MKKFSCIALFFVSVTLFTFVHLPMAQNLVDGQKVFNDTCSSCHRGGGNLMNPKRTLHMNDLEKYGINTVEAIKSQIVNGNGMPSFEKLLNSEQIENVAAYVLAKAQNGW